MKVLLCPPDFFRIEYEINPWMKITDNADKDIVVLEYALLKQSLKSAGLQLCEIEPHPKYPDMVYTANYGFVYNNIFIQSNFKYSQRRGEENIASVYFEKLGYEIKQFPKYIFFEGEGDLLRAGNRLYMGYGKRTMFEAKVELESIFETEIIPLQLIDPYFYHLDTCFAPLSEHTVLINPHAFSEETRKVIHQHFDNVLYTNEEDNKVMACNLVVYNRHIVVSHGISKALKATLSNLGYTVFETKMSQYIKGGGSVKCCSLVI